MKNLIASKKLHLTLAVASLLVASCYKLQSIEMPHEVAPGSEFTITATIVGDGAQNSIDSWGCFGVCLPEDWEVTEVFYQTIRGEKDADGNLSYADPIPGTMKLNQIYSDIMAYRYSYIKENEPVSYKWVGFSTGLDEDLVEVEGKKKPATNFSLGENDKIEVIAKIKAGKRLGDYRLEFMFGDEEDTFAKYVDKMDHDPQQDPRLFRTATFASDPEREDQKQIQLNPDMSHKVDEDGNPIYEIKPSIQKPVDVDTKISVATTTGVAEISADEFEITSCNGGIRVISTDAGLDHAVVTIYDASGKTVDSCVISGGEARLEVSKGMCVVKVLKGNHQAVRKLYIK